MIKEAYEKYAKTLSKTWEHDRTKTVGASEVGQCARRVSWDKQHDVVAEENNDWGARERGNLIEQSFWYPALRHTYGSNKFLFAGPDQKTLVDAPLSATPDGLIVDQKKDALKSFGIKNIESDCFAVECKSIDPRANMDEEKTIHRLQAIVQLGCFRRLTKYKPMYAVISYTDASFLNIVTEFVVKYDDEMYERLKKRAASIMDPKTKQKPEGVIGGGHQCRFCPYTVQCNVERHTLPYADNPVDPQLRAEFVDMVREANILKARINEDDAAYKTKQEEIRERLREKNIKKIPGVLDFMFVKGRETYDMEGLLAAAKAKKINVDKFKSKGEATSRLVLKDVGQELS